MDQPSPKQAPPEDLLRLALMEACVSSCTCLTKTPAPEFHDHTCTYRKLRDALDVLDPKVFQALHNRVWDEAIETTAALADSLLICSNDYREDVGEEIRKLKATPR